MVDAAVVISSGFVVLIVLLLSDGKRSGMGSGSGAGVGVMLISDWVDKAFLSLLAFLFIFFSSPNLLLSTISRRASHFKPSKLFMWRDRFAVCFLAWFAASMPCSEN